MQQVLASKIGPVEQVWRGYLVGVAYDPEFDEFVLATTALYREAPGLAKRDLLRKGAQVPIGQLHLLQQGEGGPSFPVSF